MTTQHDATLSKLTGTGMTVKNATDDMRGRKVTDKDGKGVGKVETLRASGGMGCASRKCRA